MPTLPGKTDGVVGWEPCVLQCRECGKTTTQDRKSVATFVILSGFAFHTCEGVGAGRRCPDCLDYAESTCPNTGRHS